MIPFLYDMLLKATSTHTSPVAVAVTICRLLSVTKERFRKAPFSVDSFSGLVWTVGLTVEIKMCF